MPTVLQEIDKALGRIDWALNQPAMVHVASQARAELEMLVLNKMPSGSGFDSGTTIDVDKCNRSKLVFNTAFHHMNDNGYYTGWTEHTVTVRATFSGIDVKVSGRDRNGIKDYIADSFACALCEELKS